MDLRYSMMLLHHADSVCHETLQDDIEAIVTAEEVMQHSMGLMAEGVMPRVNPALATGALA